MFSNYVADRPLDPASGCPGLARELTFQLVHRAADAAAIVELRNEATNDLVDSAAEVTRRAARATTRFARSLLGHQKMRAGAAAR